MKLAAAQQPAKGDILLNPGGPGESGATTGFISSAASLLGTSYNLVGMDPRGVNNSGPTAECFENPYVRDYFINQIWLSDVDVTDEKVRREFWNIVGGLNDLCLESRNDTVRYINTPAAAQDMLHYAEKLAEAEGKEPSEALVNFYGISYGTTLGITFAKLFPNRLGRFIIDGVADIEDYYSGRWMNGISQADASLDAFFTQCHEAGAKCAFNRNSTSAEALKKDYAAIIADLEENPVRVIDPAYVEFPILITALDVRGAVFIQLYRSLPGFVVIDTVLSELAQGRNVTTLLAILSAISGTQAKGLVPRERTYVPGYSSLLPRMDIACTDMNQRYNISSPDVFAEYIQETVELSKHFGDLWAGLITVKCWNRQITPPESQVFPAGKWSISQN
jgi:pimeloyl-ACP methyl ester carboxylesterase